MIQWSSLIAGPDGQIDYVRVRSLISVLLAIGAGITTVAVVFRDTQVVSEALVGIMVGALVLPLTTGRATDVLSGRSLSARIQAGQLPGRRQGDRSAA